MEQGDGQGPRATETAAAGTGAAGEGKTRKRRQRAAAAQSGAAGGGEAPQRSCRWRCDWWWRWTASGRWDATVMPARARRKRPMARPRGTAGRDASPSSTGPGEAGTAPGPWGRGSGTPKAAEGGGLGRGGRGRGRRAGRAADEGAFGLRARASVSMYVPLGASQVCVCKARQGCRHWLAVQYTIPGGASMCTAEQRHALGHVELRLGVHLLARYWAWLLNCCRFCCAAPVGQPLTES